jgi:hypothetical protein
VILKISKTYALKVSKCFFKSVALVWISDNYQFLSAHLKHAIFHHRGRMVFLKNQALQKKPQASTETPSPKIVEAPHHYPKRNQPETSMIHA